MICILVGARSRGYTVDPFFQAWARSLAPHVRCVSYESLPPRQALSGASLIFTDLERLDPAACRRAEELAARAAAAGARVLNRPAHVLRRYDLLRSLRAAGLNPFNVYRAGEDRSGVRYPVFVRRESEHNGALSGLLADAAALDAELARLRRDPAQRDDLLVVEYEPTAGADGLFRKYSVMRVGNRWIPRHVLFSSDWVDKTPDVVNEQTLAEERAFLHEFPHSAEVRRVFETAGVDYGRIDYAVRGREVITWEINTNPTIVPVPEKCDPRRLGEQAESARLVRQALHELDGPPVHISLKGLPVVVERMRAGTRAEMAAAQLWGAAGQLPGGRRIVRALRRSLDLATEIQDWGDRSDGALS